MTDKEKKAIDYLQFCYDLSTIDNESLPKLATVLNLIEKQQKEIDNSVSKDKIREKMQEYYEKASPYDCDTADYKQSQEIGGWNALRKLLEE